MRPTSTGASQAIPEHRNATSTCGQDCGSFLTPRIPCTCAGRAEAGQSHIRKRALHLSVRQGRQEGLMENALSVEEKFGGLQVLTVYSDDLSRRHGGTEARRHGGTEK